MSGLMPALSPAERQRRARRRKRDGSIVIMLEVPRRARDVLVEARWLGEWSEDDPTEVQRAIEALISGIEPGKPR